MREAVEEIKMNQLLVAERTSTGKHSDQYYFSRDQ